MTGEAQTSYSYASPSGDVGPLKSNVDVCPDHSASSTWLMSSATDAPKLVVPSGCTARERSQTDGFAPLGGLCFLAGWIALALAGRAAAG